MRKDLKPEERKPDECQVTDLEFGKISDIKPRTEDVPRQQVTTEKVTVDRREFRSSELEKPRYPKDLDIGRIVIEEIPEEDKVPEHEVVQKQRMRPRRTEMTATQREVEERPEAFVKREDVKVGKLDMSDMERTVIESEREGERLTRQRETIDGRLKVKTIR